MYKYKLKNNFSNKKVFKDGILKNATTFFCEVTSLGKNLGIFWRVVAPCVEVLWNIWKRKVTKFWRQL